jgi:hypothetical protein
MDMTATGPTGVALQGRQSPFKPLVVGAPRSGFALLGSVVIHFIPLTFGRWTVRQQVFNALVQGVDGVIAEAIVREFAANGVTEDLIYNQNFRRLTGGPKWLRAEDTALACFRKYIGVRGRGDFTLITSHPREVLDNDEVVHSHTDPGLWLRHTGYSDYVKFASLRNPVGILNSSVFSINALASEYIQKFVPHERDNDVLRQQLALYKLTDLEFVRGLVKFLVGYLREFADHWRDFHVMRWEDLILTPVPTIVRLAKHAGIPLEARQAQQIWSRLDHVNLTGHHRHNYREGKGIVGNWREWLVNEHLELFESMGLEPLMIELGYGPMPRLHERDYTPFQRKVRDAIARGEVCRETEDEDLFTFAFNKSNLASEAFPFKRHPWRTWTRIERSIFKDEPLEARVWDVAEDITGKVNAALGEFLACDHQSVDELARSLDRVETHTADLLDLAPGRMEAALRGARESLQRAREWGDRSAGAVAVHYQAQPILVESIGTYNIVAFRDEYYGVPQALGEFSFEAHEAHDSRVVRKATLSAVRAEVLARTGEPASLSPQPESSARAPSLTFVDPILEAFASACRQHLDEGRRKILLKPFNEWARMIASVVADDVRRAGGVLLAEADGEDPPLGVGRARLEDAELIVVCQRDEPEVSEQLAALVDVGAAVIAPTTTRLWSNQPLFIISIPKAGTHLLYSLAKAMGYQGAVVLQDDPAPGHWYCVEYSNSHTVAKDFFVDSVRRSPFGNRHHPFMRSPSLLIYRNPLDLVASEANYYHREGKTAFAGYLSGLTSNERVLRLIDDPWLFGTVRDRVGGFIPWLSLPNVIPVSFEELVGPRGGGSSEVQRRIVWSIQLKLHVPGDPGRLSESLFDPQSPTFDAATIGRHRDVFNDEAYRRFFALPQDFMEAFGYDGTSRETQITVPRRADEFRRRPLRMWEAEPDAPIAVQSGYLGFNIVRFRKRYMVIHQSAGDIDLASDDLVALQAQGRLVLTSSAEDARRAAEYLAVTAIADRAAGDSLRNRTTDDADGTELPRLVRENYRGFNIITYRSRWYALSQQVGPIDLHTADVAALCASGRLTVADSQEALERLIDGRLLEESVDRGAVEDLRRQLQQAETGSRTLLVDIERLQNERDRLLDRVAVLEEAVGSARDDAAAEGRRAEVERARASVLENTVGDVTSRLRERELAAEVEQARASALGNTVGALTARLQESESTTDSLSVEVAELQAWIHELQTRLVRLAGERR